MSKKQNEKILYLNGLGCAHCANKIETQVKQLNGIKNAEIDFVSQRLVFIAEEADRMPSLIKSIENIVNNVEPDVKVTYSKNQGKKENKFSKKDLVKKILLVIGSAIFFAGIVFDFSHSSELILFLISYLLIGGEVLLNAIKNITKGQIFDENFLMCVATIGAFAIGEYPEGVAVMLFYQIGEAFQDLAVDKSRKSISELMNIRPEFANLKKEDEYFRVSPEEVNAGEIIIVRPGEKIPLDGVIIEGESSLDTSALTGESLPKDVVSGDEVFSGSVNKHGVLQIKVTKEYGESTISKILEMVQNAGSKKAPTEKFITKFARYYTPIVTFSALALAVIPPLVLQDALFSDWIYRALAFLVVSCPCALVISIPLGFFGGIGGASRSGVLVKGGNYMEALKNIDTIVFDKTGTLTKGTFKVKKVQPEDNISKENLLKYAAYTESFSNHPIALSILKKYGEKIISKEITEQKEIAGKGISAIVEGNEVLAGNSTLMNENSIKYKEIDEIGTVVHVAVDKKYAGYIVIADEIKKDSIKALKELKKIGIRKTVMLTGDNKKTCEAFAAEVGIDNAYAELLPYQKVEQFEIIEKNKKSTGKTAFVGDGINDAPVLARADVGIAMGALGSDAAIEAADIVLMTDEPLKIVTAIKIAKRTNRIVWQNIIFALGIKIIILILAAAGDASLWEAVFGDVGVAIIAIINSMRAIKTS